MGVIAQQASRAPVRNLLLHGPSMGPLQNRACQANGFHFDGQLHIMRMLEMMGSEKEYITSRWLAAVYLPCGPLAEDYHRSQAESDQFCQCPAW